MKNKSMMVLVLLLILSFSFATVDITANVYDTTLPITTLTQINGVTGWNGTDIDFNLSCFDNSGCATTVYMIDSGALQTYSGDVTISTDGNHLIEYHSIDLNNNIEDTKNYYIGIDKTVPVSTYTKTPYVNGELEIHYTLTCSDASSGCASTKYRIDGGAWINYAVPVYLSAFRAYTVDYYSIDSVGNIESFDTATITPEVENTSSTSSSGPTGLFSLAGEEIEDDFIVSPASISYVYEKGIRGVKSFFIQNNTGHALSFALSVSSELEETVFFNEPNVVVEAGENKKIDLTLLNEGPIDGLIVVSSQHSTKTIPFAFIATETNYIAIFLMIIVVIGAVFLYKKYA